MKLALMTQPTFFVEEDKILTSLFEEGLDDLHLYKPGSEPMYSERLLTLLADEYWHITRTCTHLDQLKEAKRHADYVLLKYIFDSQTEADQKATFTMAELQEASRRGLIDKHVYALGGMNMDTVRTARDLGFGGIVISGDLWNRFNIHQELDYRALIDHFVKLRKAVG